ncbi:hypothetical protein ATCC90586_005036 [Pythium insidiosum]|nr:hypothetical protein ATCC90586_005036 [Pythium insidiosum]
MKAELQHVPILGHVIKTTQPILIDRKTSDGRRRALQDINDHLADPTYPPLLIFPEGTTSNQDYLTKFKVGSFASALPCQPVVIRYPFQHFDISWTPDVSALYLFLRMLCQFHNRMEVEFLPPYFPNDAERADPELYAENVRQLMAQKLKVECTNHAFEDVALLMQIGQYADQHVVPITDISQVSTWTAMRGDDVQRLVQYFMKRDRNGDGLISFDDLCQAFPADDPEILQRLIELLDQDGNGQIDFRELCMGLTALNPSRSSEDLISFAFGLYDMDHNGHIDKPELERMLRFVRSYYGPPSSTASTPSVPASGSIELELALQQQGRVDFETFRTFVSAHPGLLCHARAKLEGLRGSFRVDPAGS